MILEIVVITLAAYLAVGVAMCFYGPLARKRAAEVFNTSMTLAVSGKAAPVKLLAFRASLLLGITLLWPVLWFDHYRTDKRLATEQAKRIQARLDRGEAGLKFFRMGGVGVLSCGDCKHKQEIVCFTHGLNSSTTGYQCQSCGKFTGRSEENGVYGSGVVCECGGALENGEVLFCPACRSKKLSYDMTYIT